MCILGQDMAEREIHHLPIDIEWKKLATPFDHPK